MRWVVYQNDHGVELKPLVDILTEQRCKEEFTEKDCSSGAVSAQHREVGFSRAKLRCVDLVVRKLNGSHGTVLQKFERTSAYNIGLHTVLLRDL
jgi:hypothetical protein